MQYQICVSGAAHGSSVEKNWDVARFIGEEIARAQHILLTGATTGLPYAAAQGAKEAGGMSIGLSPAASRQAHEKKYRLPTDAFDFILHTGLHYVGRDNMLVSCADGIISIGGRMGTTHEFATAIELKKPIAILEGGGGSSQLFDDLLKLSHAGHNGVIFESDPSQLCKKLIKLLNERNSDKREVTPSVIS